MKNFILILLKIYYVSTYSSDTSIYKFFLDTSSPEISSSKYNTTFDNNYIKYENENRGEFLAINDKEFVFVPAGQILRLGQENPYSDKYYGSQLWKIHTNEINGGIIKRMKKFGGKVWDMNQDGIDVFFNDAKNAANAKKFIDNTETTYNIMIDNIQNAIDDTMTIFHLNKTNVPWFQTDDQLMTWDRYHDINIFDEFYFNILTYFPKISQILVIGRTYENREIKVLKISNGNPRNQAIFINAGVEAREWIGPAAVTLAISKLLHSWKLNSDYLNKIDWYFLPILNLDGYEYSRKVDRLWTKNRRINDKCEGVSIDRNFNYQWGKRGSSGDSCSPLYRGPQRFSEPETIALKNILNQIDIRLAAYISVGAYGQMITYPWGDDNFVPENHRELNYMGMEIVKNIRKYTNGEYQIGSSYALKFARSGNSADWVMDKINPYYVYNFYLRDQGRYGYLLPPSFIIQSGFDVYEMIRTIAEKISSNKRQIKLNL